MYSAIVAAVEVLSLLAIPHVLLAGKRPAATLAWVWGILLFPGFGAALYFAVGADRMRRRRLRKAARANLRRQGEPAGAEPLIAKLRGVEARLIRLLSVINESAITTASEVEMLANADEFYPALLEAIESARDHVHFEFFIWRADRSGEQFLQALIRAAQRGVEVRLLLDQIGCWGVPRRFFKPLIEAGGQMTWFYSLPLWRHSRFMNLRNHRKLQIIDGTTAFVGGMNIGVEHLGADPELGHWRDTQIRLRGQAAASLQEVFATDWFFSTDERLTHERYFPPQDGAERFIVQTLAGGPDLPREPVPKTLTAILNMARKRVWISTGYFVPDGLMLTALQLAAARGVDVRLLVSARTDHKLLLHVGRSFYDDLVAWGVRIFEFDEAMIHRKAMVYDDDWIVVGSANSDNRSMRLNFELGVMVQAPKEAHRLERIFEDEFERSREIRLIDTRGQPLGRRLLQVAFRPLAPIL